MKRISYKKLYMMSREALQNMCFCKNYSCPRCTYSEPMPERCENEQTRDKLFRAIGEYKRQVEVDG